MQAGFPPDVTHANEIDKVGWTRHLYGKQTHDGCIIFGGDRCITYPKYTRDGPINYAHNERTKAHATEFFPMLNQHVIKRSWTGVMPFSLDGLPIVGKIGCLPGNAFIITGMGSHGFMQGPGAGLYLANMINGCKIAKEVL